MSEFLQLVASLPEAASKESTNYTSFSVHGRKFAYLWPRTQTVGLKQTLIEQQALVSERPDVFEVQFTAGGFGWVVVYLAKVDVEELSELTFEAWRLSAPPALATEDLTPPRLAAD
jgi:hypothetical protein